MRVRVTVRKGGCSPEEGAHGARERLALIDPLLVAVVVVGAQGRAIGLRPLLAVVEVLSHLRMRVRVRVEGEGEVEVEGK